MTIYEKKKAIKAECAYRWNRDINCAGCPLYKMDGQCYSDNSTIDLNYDIMFNNVGFDVNCEHGSLIWVNVRNEDGEITDVCEQRYLGTLNNYAITATPYSSFREAIDKMVEASVREMPTEISLFPVTDCYNNKQAAVSAKKIDGNHSDNDPDDNSDREYETLRDSKFED